MRQIGLQEVVDRCSTDNKLIIIYKQGSYAENTRCTEYKSIDEFMQHEGHYDIIGFDKKMKSFYTKDYIGGPCYYYIPTIKHDILFNRLNIRR